MKWTTISEAQKEFGVCNKTIRRWKENRKIRSKVKGGHVLVDIDSVRNDAQGPMSNVPVPKASANLRKMGNRALTRELDDRQSDFNDDVQDSQASVQSVPRSKKAHFTPLRSLEMDLKATEISFQLEKLEAERERWRALKENEKIEKEDKEMAIRMEEIRNYQQKHESEERDQKKRIRLDHVKKAISSNLVSFLPTSILAEIFMQVEKTLSGMDVLSLSIQELMTYGLMVRNRVLAKYASEVRTAYLNHLYSVLQQEMKNQLDGIYRQFLNKGWHGSFKDLLATHAPQMLADLEALGIQVIK